MERTGRKPQYNPKSNHYCLESQDGNHTPSTTFSLKEISTDKVIITLPLQQSNQPFGTSQSLKQTELSNKTLVQFQPSSSTTNTFKAHQPITTSPGPESSSPKTHLLAWVSFNNGPTKQTLTLNYPNKKISSPPKPNPLKRTHEAIDTYISKKIKLNLLSPLTPTFILEIPSTPNPTNPTQGTSLIFSVGNTNDPPSCSEKNKRIGMKKLARAKGHSRKEEPGNESHFMQIEYSLNKSKMAKEASLIMPPPQP
jgi:hypothetical protein